MTMFTFMFLQAFPAFMNEMVFAIACTAILFTAMPTFMFLQTRFALVATITAVPFLTVVTVSGFETFRTFHFVGFFFILFILTTLAPVVRATVVALLVGETLSAVVLDIAEASESLAISTFVLDGAFFTYYGVDYTRRAAEETVAVVAVSVQMALLTAVLWTALFTF